MEQLNWTYGLLSNCHGQGGLARENAALAGLGLVIHPGKHANLERRATANLARYRDSAAHQAAQLAAQDQAEAGAAVFGGGGIIGLAEVLEQVGEITLRNADAGIVDLDFDPVAGRPLAAVHR